MNANHRLLAHFFDFEKSSYQRFYPFNLIRDVSDIICGALSFHQRYEYLTQCNIEKQYYNESKMLSGFFIHHTFIPFIDIDVDFIENQKGVYISEKSQRILMFFGHDIHQENLEDLDSLKENLKQQNYQFKVLPGVLIHDIGRLLEEHPQCLERDILLKASKMNMQENIPKTLEIIHHHPIFVHPDVCIDPYVVLDSREGPIWIEKGARIGSFSLLKGPLYISKDVHVNQAFLKGGNFIGECSKVGGEVAGSIFYPFANKNHEGFLGHSIVGNFVNLGALVTSSNLKNNYGKIMLSMPTLDFKDEFLLDTRLLNVGALIGDFSKLAIGTFLYTGCVIGIASNVFGNHPIRKSVPSFAWGMQGQKYSFDRLIQDIKIVMARRNQVLSETLCHKIEILYHQIGD